MSRAENKHRPARAKSAARRPSRRPARRGAARSAAPAAPKGLLGRLRPDLIARIDRELEEKLARIPTELNEYGYDPWGFNAQALKKSMIPGVLLYRYWFRVKTRGLENIPAGRVLLIGNHAGQIAIDAAMLGTAMILEGDPPRVPRGMGEFWLPRLPWFNVYMDRIGGVVGTPKNCIDMLRHGEAVAVMPEGVRGVNKLFKDRYKLMRFGLGFMRLALATDTPIVPVGIVGSEEQAIAIANLKPLAKLLGMPNFPITLTWPWLGPLGFIPFPARYYIYVGKPMHFTGDPDEDDHHIEARVDLVKAEIARLIDQARHDRKHIYW